MIRAISWRLLRMAPGIFIVALALGLLTALVALRRARASLRRSDAERDLAQGRVAAIAAELEGERAGAAAARVAQDTLRDAQERALRAERARDDLVAMVSHELRTPLNSVLGWARLLRSGKLDPAAAARAIESIEKSASAQAQIVDDLLDASRIVKGELRLDVRPVDLVPVVEAAIAAVRPAAAARNIQIAAALMPGAGPVQGDPGRLQQVFWNLLSNAVKFTPPGGRVEVRLDRDGEEAVIRVKDTGEGISPELAPHLFERFRQADSSATRKYGGLGMGLAIVRHIAEAHGGTVSAASDGRGRGATFTIRLPVPPRRRASRAAASAAPAPASR